MLRYTGDDEGSLEHYRAALQIDHTFFTSQLGLGDTLTLMGKYDEARLEYDKAIKMADNKRDYAARCFSEGHDLFLGRPHRRRPQRPGHASRRSRREKGALRAIRNRTGSRRC